MIADWDIPAATPPASDAATQVLIVVPLPSEMGGAGEILVLSAFGNLKLPAGELQPRETSVKAASRIALGVAGVRVTPERLVYVIEQPGKPLALAILCALVADDDADTKPGIRFADPGSSTGEFEPAPLRELLIEDVRAGFVRGVAHIAVGYDELGREQISTTW
jgi:ADP-ribose pyrophosphatase YjhB (NUDIX family)